MAKTRYKVEIVEHNNFHHVFDDGEEVGGSYGEPISLRLSLREKEYKSLLIGMRNYTNLDYMTLMYFLRTTTISEWHKRIIKHTFNGSLNNIEIKIL